MLVNTSMRFINFKRFVEELKAPLDAAGDVDTREFPFQIGGKEYILRFFGQPTYKVFPYSVYRKGMIYEIVWPPRDAQHKDVEDKYDRTGGNSVGDIRSLLGMLKNMVTEKLSELNPTGFSFKGADGKLDRFWKKFTKPTDFPGYVQSKMKPHIYVKVQIKDKIDQQDYEQDFY